MGTFFDQTVTTYVVKEGDTFESIAFKFYGDSTKWWAIVKANRENEDIFFPLDLAVGTRLFIPPAYVVNRS
jgi:nucleoid-associated protein YgaU